MGAVLVSGHADAYSGLPVDGTFRLRAMKDELDRALSLRMATDENYRSQLRASTRQQQLVPGISEVGFQVFNFSMGAYEYRPGRFVARESIVIFSLNGAAKLFMVRIRTPFLRR